MVAAADATGDPGLVWRAAGLLGIGAEAAAPALDAGLVEFGAWVAFGRPAGQFRGPDRVKLGRRAAAALIPAGQPGYLLGIQELPAGLRGHGQALGGEHSRYLGDAVSGGPQRQHLLPCPIRVSVARRPAPTTRRSPPESAISTGTADNDGRDVQLRRDAAPCGVERVCQPLPGDVRLDAVEVTTGTAPFGEIAAGRHPGEQG
jgi:hypothetical protein